MPYTRHCGWHTFAQGLRIMRTQCCVHGHRRLGATVRSYYCNRCRYMVSASESDCPPLLTRPCITDPCTCHCPASRSVTPLGSTRPLDSVESSVIVDLHMNIYDACHSPSTYDNTPSRKLSSRLIYIGSQLVRALLDFYEGTFSCRSGFESRHVRKLPVTWG